MKTAVGLGSGLFDRVVPEHTFHPRLVPGTRDPVRAEGGCIACVRQATIPLAFPKRISALYLGRVLAPRLKTAPAPDRKASEGRWTSFDGREACEQFSGNY